MKVHYLNSKGEKKSIGGVTHLRRTNENVFIAMTESGVELHLRLSGIDEIFQDENIEKKVLAERSLQSQGVERKKASVYTDGACKGNPGPGGWGAILLVDGKEIELSGGEESTTNNRMEITSLIQALNYFHEPYDITLTSDSKYVVDAIKKGWLENWKRNSWVKADKNPVANADLWEILYTLLEKHNVKLIWIKGHTGHEYNERCDKLATNFAKKYSKT